MAKTISVNLEAGTASFINGVEHAGKSLEGLGKDAEEAHGFLGKFQEGLELGAGFEVAEKGFELLKRGLEEVKQGFENVAEIGRTGVRLGIGPEEVSRLKYAAEVSHVAMETVESDIEKMLANLSKAESDPALAGVFSKLKLGVDELKAAQPTQAFEEISEAISHVSNAADRMNYVREIFGKTGAAILPMVENLHSLKQEADATGFTRTAEDVAKVEEAEKEWARTTKEVQTALMDLAVAAAPLIKAVATEIEEEAGYVAEVVRGINELSGHGPANRAVEESARALREYNAAMADGVAVSEALDKGDAVKAYEQQKQKVDELNKALKDCAATETDLIATGDKAKAATFAASIAEIKKELGPATALLEGLRKESDRATEAAKEMARAYDFATKDMVSNTQKLVDEIGEFGKEFEKQQEEAKEAAKAQNERLDREMEKYRELTENPAVRKYEEQLKALDDLKAHSKITDQEYNSAVNKAQHDLVKQAEKGLDRGFEQKADLDSRRFTFNLPKDPHGADTVTLQKQQLAYSAQWDQYFRQIWQQLTNPGAGDTVASIA